LLPEYNGSGKAIWLDISSGEVDDWFDALFGWVVAKRAEECAYYYCESAGKIIKDIGTIPKRVQR
jgi:hypothetical protein